VPEGTIHIKLQTDGTYDCYAEGDTLPDDFPDSTVFGWSARSVTDLIGTTAYRALMRDAFNPAGNTATIDMVGLMTATPSYMSAADDKFIAGVNWLESNAHITGTIKTILLYGSQGPDPAP
jgi:hypothetical protein